MTNMEYRRLSISEASALIAKKKLSPVELVNAYLDRIHEVEDTLNAFTEVHEEAAQKIAKSMEDMLMVNYRLGPLHGIPIVIKDNISLAGYPLRAGSKIFGDYVPQDDAGVVARLKSAGAIIIGHTNMHELAHGATTDNPYFGAAHNPWNTQRFCAGSSGGSGAAVSGGEAIAALGTDTGGSVRLPSSVTGIVGLRPTLGRVSNRGIVPVAWTLDTCGPMTRTVQDNAILLNIMAGYDSLDPTTVNNPTCDYTSFLGKRVKGMRIGVLPESMYQVLQPDVYQAIQEAVNIFREMGAEIIECQFEVFEPEIANTAFVMMDYSEPSAYHQTNIRERPQDFGKDVRRALTSCEFMPATAYIQAQRYRRLIHQEFKEAFDDVDVFLYPTMPFTALPLKNGYDGYDDDIIEEIARFTSIGSLTGFPTLSIPCGLDHDGLPIGMSLMGPAFREDIIYKAAYAFEQECNLLDRLPAFREIVP